jgi:hypothetical protein
MKYDDASWHAGEDFPKDVPEDAGATHTGMFTDEDLNDEGNAFAQAYFDFEKGAYLSDYDRVLTGGLPSQYHVADTWGNFDALRPVLDKRLEEWRRKS